MYALRLLLWVAPFAAATPLEKRADNCALVNKSIQQISAATLEMARAINAYTGGIPGTKPILDAIIDQHAANRQGFNAAQTSTMCTEAESKKIADSVNNSVGKTIPPSYKLLESKKALFDAAELTDVVEAYVNKIRNDHETISLAIARIITPDQLPSAGAGAAKIEAAFLEASTVFGINCVEDVCTSGL